MYLYKTIKKFSSAEEVVNKSRFIGYSKPVKTIEEATEFIEEIKKKHKDATHNVPVYLLGEKMDVQKYSDDGEPSGTAGVPILSMLKNEKITNVVVVVTRYFGGIKLGTGGLVRSYTNIAKKSLENAGIIEVDEFIRIAIEIEYTLHGKLLNYINNEDSVIIENTIYTDKVKMILLISKNEYEKVNNTIIDLTNSDVSFGKKEIINASIRKNEVITNY
ncbi:YigZ family protein [Helicovermis profundi]|uniref:YigZ family protein n=1 Tax=Helicovermis profundi TaxID=3065157 RepID=A0AAU9E5L3_9FIRM|nr:YigZ family protein [Clostridia bacterium S502]